MLNLPVVYEGGIRRGTADMDLQKTIPLNVGEVALVSCPAKNFQAASIADCKECPFCYGFERQPSGEYRSVCGAPIGRRITKVRVNA